MSTIKDTNDIIRFYNDNVLLLEDIGFTNEVLERIQLQKKIFQASGTALPRRALCLGIGELARDGSYADVGAAQLNLFKSLLEAFEIPASQASVYDPAFKEDDKSFVRSFGFTIPDTPEAALEDLVCKEPTLIFGTFLPLPVNEMILEQNWKPEHLMNVMLLNLKFDGWVNDHYHKWARFRKGSAASSYLPRIDRCIPLFEVAKLLPDGWEARVKEEPDQSTSVCRVQWSSRKAHALDGFYFQWIPPYRVYASGERFWNILRLEDTTYTGFKQEHEEEEERRNAEKKGEALKEV